MTQFTFRIPPDASSAIIFDVMATDEKDAVRKAREALREQTDHAGDLRIDLSYGLTFGRIVVADQDVSEQAIVDKYTDPRDSEPF